MSSSIHNALAELFETYRLVFWYAPESVMQEEREGLSIPGVEILEVEGNEFALKKRALLEAPQQKFLFYAPYEAPDDRDNWLLDVELRGHRFQTDPASLRLQRLQLSYAFKPWMERHLRFFSNKERVERFERLLDPKRDRETEEGLNQKLLAAVFRRSEGALPDLLLAYGGMVTTGKGLRETEHQLQDYGLYDYFWGQVQQHYGYDASKPTAYGFFLELFKGQSPLFPETPGAHEGAILLHQWQDRQSAQEVLSKLSQRIAQDVALEERARQAELKSLLGDRYFEAVEQEVIRRLAEASTGDDLSLKQFRRYHEDRKPAYWYGQYQTFYEAMDHGLKLREQVAQLLEALPGDMALESGPDFYTQTGYEVDQAYRQFIGAYNRLSNNTTLQGLYQRVNQAYIEDWLPRFGRWWQERLEAGSWKNFPVRHLQRRFYEDVIAQMLHHNKRVFVIISDALRYECAQALYARLNNHKRYQARLDYRITSLPSYTQLGMAALLPHHQLRIKEGSDTVLADERSTQGLDNRRAILEAHYGPRATAMMARDMMNKSKEEGRELIKNYDLVYLYHDQIDHTGDQKTSEGQVFEAVDIALEELEKFIGKIYGLNGYNIFLTSDHGFLYQDKEVAEGDFSPDELQGDVWKRNRRYILGAGLQGSRALMHWKGDDFNLNPDMDILIPNGHQRLRVQGAGSRYVHGGASLPEIVTPVLHVRVVKEDTVTPVEVSLIQGSQTISGGILQVRFFQVEPVSESRTPRTLRAWLQAPDGTILSDRFEHKFDMTEPVARQREVAHTFNLLSETADKYNQQEVGLVAEEPIRDTGQGAWRHYRSLTYRIMIFMERDF